MEGIDHSIFGHPDRWQHHSFNIQHSTLNIQHSAFFKEN
jgi:hypothetical protein